VAVLPASAEPIGAAAAPDIWRLRTVALVGALAALVLCVVPPVFTYAHRYEFVEAIQFDLAAFAVPALLVVSAPIRLVGGALGARLREWALRLNGRRRRHPSPWRALGFAAADVVVFVAWRTPGLMNALERHRGLLAVEVVSLVAAGLPLWVELVRSPPLEPRVAHPWRAVVAVLTMWSVWITAYAVGLSGVSWYVAFHHVAGGLGTSADQELSTGALWFGAAVSFVPVVFIQLLAWLRNGDDPDAELRAILRTERWFGKPD
jgi:cytochrome c oxidase assembly factor CtaG